MVGVCCATCCESKGCVLGGMEGGMYVLECMWKSVGFILRGGKAGFVRWWSGWFGWRHLFARSDACMLRCSFMGTGSANTT